MAEFAFPSTGDPERDRMEAARFRRQNDLIEAGQCPNSCGPLETVAENKRECAACNFSMTTTSVRAEFFS